MEPARPAPAAAMEEQEPSGSELADGGDVTPAPKGRAGDVMLRGVSLNGPALGALGLYAVIAVIVSYVGTRRLLATT